MAKYRKVSQRKEQKVCCFLYGIYEENAGGKGHGLFAPHGKTREGVIIFG